MKTKDLIAALQKLDPTGEIEVVADGKDIYFAEKLPMFYDGMPIILIRNEDNKGSYNIDGLRITGKGNKIVLHLMDGEDVIADNPNCIIDLDGEYAERHYKEWADLTRKYYKNENFS